MKYRVVIHAFAAEDLDRAFLWAAKRAMHTAFRWSQRLQRAIESLERQPQRCGLATENSKVGIELRQLLFGRRPNVYRVIFTIDEDEDMVRVLRVVRAQRRSLSRREIEDANKAGEP